MTERFTEELLREVWNEAMRQQAEPYVLEERAAIVTWLRSGQFEDLDGHDIAEEIEAGAHTNYHPPSTRRQP
jgi:hypothetical protein